MSKTTRDAIRASLTDADRMPRPKRTPRRHARRTATRQAFVAAAIADRI